MTQVYISLRLITIPCNPPAQDSTFKQLKILTSFDLDYLKTSLLFVLLHTFLKRSQVVSINQPVRGLKTD